MADMKPCQAAALCLVGWYLMLPPLRSRIPPDLRRLKWRK
jgi:hypothetical protein